MKKTFIETLEKTKIYARTNILFITFIISSLINATILRAVTVQNVLSIKPMIADLCIILLLGSLAYFLKPRNRFKYFLVWSIIFILDCIINCIYYKNYLSFASFSLLATLTQLGGYTDAVMENILELKDFIYVWQLFALIFMHLQLKKTDYYDRVETQEQPKIRFLNTIVVTLIILGFFISMLTGTDISRLRKQWNREYIVMEFGIYTYQLNDAFSCVRTKLNSMFGYDEASKEFRDYYAVNANQPSNNMYTGIFKDKNVLVIHAESIMNFLISDDNRNGEPTAFNGEPVTPNLNRLASEGLYFSNFYSEESAGTSSDTEFTFNTSLLPASNGTVFMNYFNREYETTPKFMKNLGYYTFSMHGNKASAWNRANVHPNLGYDHFYAYTDAYNIDEEIGLGISDKSFFSQSVDIIKNISTEHDKWYGLLIMLTNHTPFSGINDYIASSDWDYPVDIKYQQINEETGEMEEKIAPYMENTQLGNYFKSARYADEAIGELLTKMDNEGLLDNTVVIIYGDHDNKLKKSQYSLYYNYDYLTDSLIDEDDENYIKVDEYFYELNRSVPLIIWSKDIIGTDYSQEVTKVMGMVDVQPTLANMFGFHNKYALGHDIFSIEDNVVVFPSGNWLTNKLYYNSAKEAYRQLDLNSDISIDYVNYYRNYAETMNNISNNIITYDLIKRVGNNPENETMEENSVIKE